MSARMKFWGRQPAFYQAQLALTTAAKKGLDDPVLAELVVLRASQLNRCAFCIDMHVKNLRQAGVGRQRIDLLPAWEEAGDLYSARERAALAFTEAVTVLTEGHVPDEVYERAAAHFDERELAHLLAVVVAINNWNRVNVTVRQPPGLEL
ncbi:alkyl hydroperoxide reductase AhpD [Streptomyces nigrescens]|uniref:Alkyl hydroperoxide reductase AhpD n=2 Tax=Streptomyces TaxID=1883 RepID=A0ABM8A231_STRNI|nr:carboxymuconolactone decarboxylase family protein [Streptomyces nigrescens]MEE4421179.1 carboxymuconolactone decarboxylase family protein [Streptomyces sp. DSM 41528]BDM72700.1 alkyl hydroperoxide reductase AhpD [Streptomyces nigrescens]